MTYSYLPKGLEADPAIKNVMNNYLVRQLWEDTFIDRKKSKL